MTNNTELDQQVRELLKTKDKIKANDLFEKYKSADIAESLQDLENPKNAYKIFTLFSPEEQLNLITYLDNEDQEQVFNHLPEKELARLVDDIYSDDLVDIIDEQPRKTVQRILVNSTPEKRKELNSILKYDEETAGGIMTVNYVKFPDSLTINQAVTKIRANHENFENIDDIFIINDYGTLLGEIKLKDLVINPSNKKLAEIMDTSVVAVNILEDQEEVIKLVKKYDINTVPVVDETGKLVGVITTDDIMDVVEKEQTEDLQKLAGITPLDDDSIFETSIWKMILSRSIWLVVGILLATVTQILIVVFLNKYGVSGALSNNHSNAFASVYILVPMVVVIAAVCGIGINQTTTSMVRVLSLRNYDKKELIRIGTKEILTSVILAFVLLIVNLVRLVIFYEVQFNGTIDKQAWYGVAASTVAIFIGVVFAGVIGTLLPILANKFKLDPAIVSSPLTTSIIDIITVAVFFGIGLAFY